MPFGVYQFKMMTFGLCGAAATFRRLMDKVLQLMTSIAAYISEIVNYGKSWNEHLKYVAAVLQTLRSMALTAKSAKCC